MIFRFMLKDRPAQSSNVVEHSNTKSLACCGISAPSIDTGEMADEFDPPDSRKGERISFATHSVKKSSSSLVIMIAFVDECQHYDGIDGNLHPESDPYKTGGRRALFVGPRSSG